MPASKIQPISYTLDNVKGGRIEVREFKPNRNENVKHKRFKAELILENGRTIISFGPSSIESLAKEIKTKCHLNEEQSDEILNGIKAQLPP